MSIPFRQCMDALLKSPASPHRLVGRSPASAKWGGLSFGDFSLATQRKVTRPPQEDESSASKQVKTQPVNANRVPKSSSGAAINMRANSNTIITTVGEKSIFPAVNLPRSGRNNGSTMAPARRNTGCR
jgi:hypothetical protein